MSIWEKVRPVLWTICCLPFLRWCYLYSSGGLGDDPGLWMMESSGQTAFVMLCLTLCVTPLRQLFAVPGIMVWRRVLGLMTFFYAFCHFSVWAGVERKFSFALMGQGIVGRPTIVLGILSFLMLIALALTSNQAMIRKLGRRWQKLHRLVYVVAVLVSLHFIGMQREDESAAHAYIGAAVIAALLIWRVIASIKQKQAIAKKLSSISPVR